MRILSRFLAIALGCSGLAWGQSPAVNGIANQNITGGIVSSVNGQAGAVTVKAVSQRVVYTSQLLGTTGDATVAPGSSAVGTTDRAAALNAALSPGNVKLIVDGQYALSTSLLLTSGDSIECLSRTYGFIMRVGSNAEVIMNAHPANPTTASGTGGYLLSNVTDKHMAVRHCMLNANSTEAVTGSNPSGIPHAINPNTNMFVMGNRFGAVDDVVFEDNEVYDSGIYGVGFANATNVQVLNNYIHQPLPIVQSKNTDGIHFVGPATYLTVNGNRVNAGDDSIAFNAEDGNEPGSGDPNGPMAQWPGWLWGPITDVHADNNYIDHSTAGLRLYSAHELIDRVTFSHTNGYTFDEASNITAQAANGPGNVGSVLIDGFNVQSDGSYTLFNYNSIWHITSNIKNFELDGVKLIDPAVNWPVIDQVAGTIQNLSAHNWDINTQNSTLSSLIYTGGTVGQVVATGINWQDMAAGAGTVFAGNAPPSLTLSGYNGPSRILAAGYSPTTKNGDAFQNQYVTTGPGTTYLNTTFAESHSASLNGIVPATETDTGAAWAVGSGAFTTGASSGVVASGGGYALLPVNQNNYKLTASVSGVTTAGGVGDSQIFVRLNDTANFELIEYGTNYFAIKDYTANAQTLLAGGNGSYPSSNTITVTVNGNAISATLGTGQTLSATIPPGSSGVSSGTKIGIGENGSSNTITYSSLSIQGLNGTTTVTGGPPVVPTTITFGMGSGATGTDVGWVESPSHAGTVSECKVITQASDSSTPLTFTIKQNGVAVFTSPPTVAAGTARGTATVFSLTSGALSVAKTDKFTIDITSGTSTWAFSAQLE